MRRRSASQSNGDPYSEDAFFDLIRRIPATVRATVLVTPLAMFVERAS